MATSESVHACGVTVPKDGIVDENGTIHFGDAGGQYVVAVLESGASTAQKVQALRTAGIRTAREVNLWGEELTGDMLQVLAAALEGSDTLTEVLLCAKPMGYTGAEALGRMAAPSLKTLGLIYCHMTVADMKRIASWLAGNPPLRSLSIFSCTWHPVGCTDSECEEMHPGVGNDALTVLADGLQSNSNLAVVHIEDCGMTVTSAAAWAGLLKSSTALREVEFGGESLGDDEVAILADAAVANGRLERLDFQGTSMTDTGMATVADVVARHPSLHSVSVRYSEFVTDAGRAALSLGVRRALSVALETVHGLDLAKYDDSLPDHIVEANDSDGNTAVLSYYRAQARIRRRVAAVAVLRMAWRRSKGRPERDVGGDEQTTRAAKLAHMVQLRRVCRVREGTAEVVEPFGRCVVAYL